MIVDDREDARAEVFPACSLCGHPFARKHRVIPGSMGGTYDPGNVVHLCPNHHAMVHLRMKHREAPDSLTPAERSRLGDALGDVGLSLPWSRRIVPALAGVPARPPGRLRLEPGTRVRLDVPTMAGNRGPGTVVACFGDGPQADVFVRLDGARYFFADGWTDCCRHELTVIR